VKRTFRIAVMSMGLLGCRGGNKSDDRGLGVTLDQALGPAFFASALRKLGGAHFHATTRMSVAIDGPAPEGERTDAVTTTTDVWLDRTGNYRIVESNDRDGGREVVLFGRELNVALRYGKMIRRAAENPEPDRLLQEALGGPWAAWQVAAPDAAIQRRGAELVGGAKAESYQVSKSAAKSAKSESRAHDLSGPPPEGLREWRGTVAVDQLDGRMSVDQATGALIKAELTVGFTGKRPAGPRQAPSPGRPAADSADVPLRGRIEVRAEIDQAASTPPIVRPAAEELSLRQRIVPEQKELLDGLVARDVPPAPRPGGRSPKAAGKGQRP
jgi:hypothetical protein